MKVGVPLKGTDRGKVTPGTIVTNRDGHYLVRETKRPTGEWDLVSENGNTRGCLGLIKFFTPVYIPDIPKVGDIIALSDFPKLPAGSMAVAARAPRWQYFLLEDERFVEYGGHCYPPKPCAYCTHFKIKITHINY